MSRGSRRPGCGGGALVALLACLVTQACDTFSVDVGVARLALDGDVALGPSGGGVDIDSIEIDTGDSLGIDSFSETPYVRLQVRHEKATITLSTLWYNQTGSGVLQQNFGDLLQGTSVSTSAEIVDLRLAMYYDLVDERRFSISPGVGFDYLSMEFSATGAGSTEWIDDSFLMPMAFVRTAIDLGSSIDAMFEIGANFVDVGDTLVDFDAIIRWNPLPLVELFAGYRFILFDGDGQSADRGWQADILLHGGMIGLKLPF